MKKRLKLKERQPDLEKANSEPLKKTLKTDDKKDFIKKNTLAWDLQQLIRTLSSLCVFCVVSYFQTSHAQNHIHAASQTSATSLHASYQVAFLIAKEKNSYTIAEELIALAAAILAETMVDKKGCGCSLKSTAV